MAIQLNMLKHIIFSSLALIGIFLSACNESSQKVNDKKSQRKAPIEKQVAERPIFNEDSCFNFIQHQVDFGPRINNSVAHDQCRDYLIGSMERYGASVMKQSAKVTAHDGKQLDFTNIIAALNPSAKKRILISAHWDSRPWADNDSELKYHDKPIDAANDGASGVAVMLELTRIFSKDSAFTKDDIGLDFIFFDAEDYGVSSAPSSFCYGSQYWAKNPVFVGARPMYGINLDMVGGKDAHFYYEGFSNQYARHILDKVWAQAHKLGHSDMFVREISYSITDDHLYVNNAGIPCIDIIHKDPTTGTFVDTWHTHDDTIDEISKQTLDAVGSILVELIYKEMGL